MKMNLIPQPKLAIIDESSCIGCTKCIKACPVDAIIGTNKHMHVILPQDCIGCELCVASCPVDCIVMAPVKCVADIHTVKIQQERKQQRLLHEQQEKAMLYHQKRCANASSTSKQNEQENMKKYIIAALNRVKQKRLYSQQLIVRRDANERAEGVYTQYMTEGERVCNKAENHALCEGMGSSAKSI